MYLALKVKDSDNVATVFAEGITPETVIEVRDKQGNVQPVTALDAIPYGHKLALCGIPAGEEIVKYGEVIGVAAKDIKKGNHVHVHNLDSMRGRGDLGQEG